MVSQTDQKRLAEFNALKGDPALTLFYALKRIESELELKFKKMEVDIKTQLLEEIKKTVKEVNPNSAEMVEKILANTLKNIKGETGEKGNSIKGDKGEIGPEGKRGLQGLVGLQGRDGKDGLNGQDGKNGQDGQIGLKGDRGDSGSPDTPKDIKNKLERLKGDDRLDVSSIKNLEKVVNERTVLIGGDRGRRVWPQTDSSIAGTLSGTIDGTNATFTLRTQAKPDTIKVFVNGFRQGEGSAASYTVLSNYKSIVFNTGSIPRSEGGVADEIIVDYEIDM